MTTQIAIGLGAVILLAFGLDAALYHSAGALFLAAKIVDLIDWVAFWR
ncbi:MAG: hypothetical protein AB7U46_12860 [Paenirhodobacter sp.]